MKAFINQFFCYKLLRIPSNNTITNDYSFSQTGKIEKKKANYVHVWKLHTVSYNI